MVRLGVVILLLTACNQPSTGVHQRAPVAREEAGPPSTPAPTETAEVPKASAKSGEGVDRPQEPIPIDSLMRTFAGDTRFVTLKREYPDYQITIFSSGRVLYEGRREVRLVGTHVGRISQSRLNALDRALKRADFCHSKPMDDYSCLDASSVRV